MSPPDARSPALVTPAAQDIEAEQQGLSNTETGAAPQALATALRPIGGITVGQRFRRDLGDIAGLAKSIAEIGLLHPIVVTPDGRLIAGDRRLRAAKLLGWTEIPVRIVDLDAVVRGEFAENAERKDFSLSESVAIKRALEPLEKTRAKERMLAGKPSGKFPKGRALDNVARVVGKDRRTIEKAEAVVDAAEAEPEKFGPLLAAMDKTGRVNAPYKRLQVAKQAEKIRAEPPPLPGNGPCSVAVADIAWAAEPEGDADRAARRGYWPYPTLTIEQACALPVDKIMADDAILWMWVTNFILVRGLHLPVLTAWDFEPKNIITWPKEKAGTGIWLRGQSEHVVMAVRGKPIVTLTNQSTVLFAPTRGHSEKPAEFYDLVEGLCPAPRYCDLFSRHRHNDKWDCHGDEAPADDLSIPKFLRRAETGS
jgi:N6-adenosine-specific RNA methylase IME4